MLHLGGVLCLVMCYLADPASLLLPLKQNAEADATRGLSTVKKCQIVMCADYRRLNEQFEIKIKNKHPLDAIVPTTN